MMSARVEVLGSREAIKALSKLPKEIRNETRRNIRTAVRPIQAAARANIPDVALSGWSSWQRGRLYWDAGAARKGIGIRVGGGRQSDEVWRIVTLTQRSAPGAVFEVAGRRSSGKTPQGRAFIRGLNSKHGRASRGVWRAVDANGQIINSSVKDAVDAAVRTVINELG